MDEQNNNIFGTSGEVDLGSAELPQGFDPFASAPVTETATREEPQTPPAPTQSQVKNASEAPPAPKPKVNPVPATLENPLTQAMEAAETKDAEAAKDSIYTRAPKFAYAGVSEDIKEPMKTFEDLRIEKSSDFPELEDGKRVSWTVEYGKITKSVSDPKGTSVGKMKTEIETSKAFLDALKKMKPADREKAVCKIKPRITAQSKGELSEYKDVFPSLEAARASDKIICLIPAQDGRLYEMRKTPMGTFTTPAGKVAELPRVEAGFVPAFPLIPARLLGGVIGFFRSLMDKTKQFEALVHILWDQEEKQYLVHVPRQTVSKVSVHAELKNEMDPSRYVHVMDIHSHNNMPAQFSAIDDQDEKATRLYAVIGRLDQYWPAISVRLSNGGKYMDVPPRTVFAGYGQPSYPGEWEKNICKSPQRRRQKNLRLYLQRSGGGKE